VPLLIGALAAPFLLGAKSCDAVVGDDRTRADGCPVTGDASVASGGECGQEGPVTICGGLRGMPCAADEFCDFPPDAACGLADGAGTCAPLPDDCSDVFAPVCGCDGATYSNACLANAAGTSVASNGQCKASGVVCGGLGGSVCAASEFCNFPPDMGCGLTDGAGTCEARPATCDAVVAPVCACDGVTYANECEAHRGGFSVVQDGSCP
jgi:hypothetical protein